MHIQSIPMWTGKRDNYAYLVSDPRSNESFILDPGHAVEVLPVLKESKESGLKLTAIVNTHHHGDHSGGNNELLEHFPVPVIAGKDSPSVTDTPAHGAVFNICQHLKVTALHTPCHTEDSICYFVEDGDERVVFTGDTLFHGGCGRFFEGSPEKMDKALNEILASLPDDTRVYPGHEYTKGNAKFAMSVSQDQAVKHLLDFATNNTETQGKFTIGDEKKHNLFMRINEKTIQDAVKESTPLGTMAKLRELKNSF